MFTLRFWHRFLDRLESPQLFKLALALFVLSVAIPDPLPFVDELLLGIAALILARRKKQLEAS